jgi:hypothetical protein
MAREHVTPSLVNGQEPAGTTARRVTLPGGSGGKLYSEAVAGEKLKSFKLTVKSRDNCTPESIKELLRAKINPTEIKVGINTFKALKNGKVLIETNSKEEIEALEKNINEKCGVDLEANIYTLRKPRLIILNIPEDISITNLEDTLLAQNPDLKLRKGDIVAKFSYETKKQTRNLVMEVGAQTRKLLIQNKAKLGWHICKIEDYVVANRCFKCSRFNHRVRDCRGEVTCPLCTGSHTLKECKTDPRSYKCINCSTYKYNPSKNISVDHSSLDKRCPSMQAIIEKYRLNTDY